MEWTLGLACMAEAALCGLGSFFKQLWACIRAYLVNWCTGSKEAEGANIHEVLLGREGAGPGNFPRSCKGA